MKGGTVFGWEGTWWSRVETSISTTPVFSDLPFRVPSTRTSEEGFTSHFSVKEGQLVKDLTSS